MTERPQTVFELTHRENSKQWLRLSPDLVSALTDLAERENSTLERLIINLINEALVHRLRNR